MHKYPRCLIADEEEFHSILYTGHKFLTANFNTVIKYLSTKVGYG